MNQKQGFDSTVILGEGVVTVKRAGSSTPLVANILGMDRDADGKPVRVWLDRLVHGPKDSLLGGWQVSGAVSTVLSATVEEA